MKLTIDSTRKTLTADRGDGEETHDLYSDKAFEIISDLWVKVGWNQKYVYTFSWMGRPIIQLPEDIVRIQEVLDRVRPDVVVETGVAHGGSLVLYASLFKAMGRGRVIGVDIEIRPHNRKAIEEHPLASWITLVEGSSTAPQTAARVREQVKPGESVLVILDSNHTRQHVLDELDTYHGLITPGSYIVATDGVMRDLGDVPRGHPSWVTDNPANAAETWVARHPEFELEAPRWPFNESSLARPVTHWPSAYLRRR